MRAELRALIRCWGLSAALLAGAAAAPAQRDSTRAPADTLPRPGRDTVRVSIPDEARRADTLPDLHRDSTRADSVPPDSARPAPNLPDFPQLGANGFGPGVWNFTADDLARFHGLTLLEFFYRIPGLVVTRSGSYGRQAGISPYGAGGGRVRIFLDGWELRAMNAGTGDVQRIALADIASLRVQRGLGEVRVDVSTLRMSDRRPYAQLEGADGDFDSRILRPYYAQAWGPRVELQVGLDVVETAGFRRAERFGANTPIAKLSYAFNPNLGLQLEYRGTSWNLRQPGTANPLPGEALNRGELLLRGRGHFGALWLDGAVGRSKQTPAGDDSLVADVRSTQAYARAALDVRSASLVGTVRLHQGEEGTWAPDERELSVAGYLNPGRGLTAGGELRHRTRDGEGGLAMEGWARAALAGGLAVFGSVESGDDPITFLRDSVREVVTVGGAGGLPGAIPVDSEGVQLFRDLVPTLRAFRAGGEWARGRWSFGAAYVVHDLDRIAPYGMYFDRGLEPVDGGSLSAVEAYAGLPLFWKGVRAEGWFMGRLGGEDRPYLPKYMGRAAIELHDVYRAGNLEPTLRVELLGRDRATLPGTDQTAPRYMIMNAFVQIRILDIRMFWRLDNMFNNRAVQDAAGTRLPGAMQMWGVRWFFRN